MNDKMARSFVSAPAQLPAGRIFFREAVFEENQREKPRFGAACAP